VESANIEGRLDFLRDRARRSSQEVVRYINSRKGRWGVEPIFTTLQFASRTCYAAKRRPPCVRKVRDEKLKPEISRVHAENLDVYGADKVWTQMKREGYPVARCTVERLMKDLHLSGA
jgi:putative transposase